MRRQRFAILNLAMLLMIAMTPIMERGRAVTRMLFVGMFVFILISAVHAVGSRWHARGIVIPLSGLTALFQILDLLVSSTALQLLANSLGIVTLLCVILLILRRLFTVTTADYETINAALCVYLLMGVLWSIAYSMVEGLAPGSFAYPLAAGDAPEMHVGGQDTVVPLYYSFVTMTTLGYGDIVPIGATAKVLAIGQAMLGQIYLVVLVARLVGLQVAGATVQRD